MKTSTSRNIAVIGGGISGLTTALRLNEQGTRCHLDRGIRPARRAGDFLRLRRTHVREVLPLHVAERRAFARGARHTRPPRGRLWKPSSFAYAYQNEVFPLNTPVDLLRFKPLSFIERIRVITSAYGHIASDKGLDDMTTAQWLSEFSGASAFKKFWQPMLEAKFGDRYQDVPALWFWTRFNREKGESKGEVKGYLRGGYKRVTDQFAKHLRAKGVELRLNTPVERIDLDDGLGHHRHRPGRRELRSDRRHPPVARLCNKRRCQSPLRLR